MVKLSLASSGISDIIWVTKKQLSDLEQQESILKLISDDHDMLKHKIFALWLYETKELFVIHFLSI